MLIFHALRSVWLKNSDSLRILANILTNNQTEVKSWLKPLSGNHFVNKLIAILQT